MTITLEALMAPRLRWARLAAMIVPALLAFVLIVSMVLPPTGSATLKAVFILLFTLVSLASAIFSLYAFLTRDESAGLKEQRASARRRLPAGRTVTRQPAGRPARSQR
jgi:hypothetical protein